MTVQAPPSTDLARVADAFGDLLYSIDDAQWWVPTPCSGWNVRDLVAHVVAGNRNFTHMMCGRVSTSAADGDRTVPGPMLRQAYHVDLPALLAAFDAPRALSTPVRMPVGTVPGLVALRARTTDVLVHGWDLARAIGASAQALPQDVANAMALFVRARRPALPSGRFAAAQPSGLDSSPVDRLAAMLGRAL
jgi:uncharacterized protein (TIGR03086 family)